MGHSLFTNIVMAMHGGAGTLSSEIVNHEREIASRESIAAALRRGHEMLCDGASALDVVCAAVQHMEDDPLFNAGHGASFARDGSHTLDASIMEGSEGRAGAVAGVRTIRNPIVLARAVLEQSPYVLLAGEGADEFGRACGLEVVENSYFDTSSRRALLDAYLRSADAASTIPSTPPPDKFGTVGAVARDRDGHLAAATSTGGMMGKRFGRVGDSPVIGAGTWAMDATCAISGTGHGEFYIRQAVAHDIAARMAYGNATLDDASYAVIQGTLVEAGGDGGIIALDAAGNAVLTFNTEGMFRGVIHSDGTTVVAVFAD
jgi:beta-aspartyl-peptidase (threonine type)